MTIAIIFAGGTGQRMNTRAVPKQFLELHGKPIIIYTLEHFQEHELVDGIIVVCIEGWIEYCQNIVARYGINKVRAVIPGGETGLLSRYMGVMKAAELYPPETICLMHDGVRPLIDHETITKNVRSVEAHGSAVTVAPASETVAINSESGKVGEIVDRSRCQLAKAPQSFRLGALCKAHKEAIASGMEDCIDTAYLMQSAGYDVYAVEGSYENIKITTPTDFYIFRAIMDIRENSQILGM